jgi:peroxiredoxin
MKDSSGDSLIGLTIGERYRIISQLGVGGMGTAYRAWDEQGGLPVVIKIPKKAFLEDPKFAERFQREIRLLQGFVHPHIVPIADVGEHDGLPFVVMRFLPGGSLSNRRLRDDKGQPRPNPPAMLHLWLPAVATALDFIHAQGVVHRDVKPANIFFDAFWGAYLGDFGIAKVVSESDAFDKEHTLTATSMGIGTPEYMAPEQFTPKAVVDGRADQYALGVVVYEMLASERPFTGAAAHLIVEVMTHPVPPLPVRRSDVSPRLVDAVRRALSKRPSERFQTCSEFASEVLRDVPAMAEEQGVARLLCPQCSNILKLPTTAAGQKGKCPRCQTAMKVADDLGAMWLLEEARRQADAASGVWQDAGESTAEGESVSDEQALEAFRPASEITPTAKAARKRRRGILSWIDEHGLLVGGGLAVAALLPWFLLQKSVIQREIQSSPFDKFTIERLRAEKQAVEKKLAEANEREKSLQEQLKSSPKVVASSTRSPLVSDVDQSRSLTSLTVEQAKALAQQKGYLLLNGLTTLSNEAAKALAQFKGSQLELNGLTTLSDEAAKALAQFKGMLGLRGLITLSDDAAKALAQQKGYLILDGLNRLSPAAADALAQHRGGYLCLQGLTILSDEAATALAQHEGGLILNGLTSLSPDAAKALAQQTGGYLRLDGLTTLSDEAAKALAQHAGGLSLNGLTTLSDEAAKSLAQHAGGLSLNGLTTLSDEAAKALAQFKGELGLRGLITLSDDAAKALAQQKGKLDLWGLITLSDDAAKALAQHKGELGLRGLITLSDDAAKALRANPKVELPLKFNR